MMNAMGLSPESGPPDGTQDGEFASAEEQAIYQRFVANGLMIIFGEETMPDIVDLLDDEAPEDALATATATVVFRVVTSAMETGVDIPADIILHGGTEIFENIAELMAMSGIADITEDEQAMERAYYKAVDETRMVLQQAGVTHPEEAQSDLMEMESMFGSQTGVAK